MNSADCKTTEVVESQRQKCEVWTRVMGYHRPISSFNIGKKQEYADRKVFEVTGIDADGTGCC